MSRRRRTVRYHDWDEVRTEVEQLLAGGYEKGGNWSLGQICNHLAIVMEMAVDGFPKQMPRVVQALFRKLFLNTMVQHKVVKFRAPTPRFAKQDEPIDDEQGGRTPAPSHRTLL